MKRPTVSTVAALAAIVAIAAGSAASPGGVPSADGPPSDTPCVGCWVVPER